MACSSASASASTSLQSSPRTRAALIVVLTLLPLGALGQPVVADTGALPDLPPLSIAIQDQGYDIASSVPAGRYLVSVANERRNGISISFVAPPPGHSLAETQDALSDQDTAADWLYEATFIPGPYAAAGKGGQGIVDLPPGQWLVWGGNDIPFAGPVLTVADEGATTDGGPGAGGRRRGLAAGIRLCRTGIGSARRSTDLEADEYSARSRMAST